MPKAAIHFIRSNKRLRVVTLPSGWNMEVKGYPELSPDDGYFASEEEAEREWLRREVGQFERP